MPTDKVTVKLDRDAHRLARIEAAKEGKGVAAWIAEAIKKTLGMGGNKEQSHK